MAKRNKERVLDYLWSVAPQSATNSDIRTATGIGSHQQVYMITQELRAKGIVRGVQVGSEWHFSADESLPTTLAPSGQAASGKAAGGLDSARV